MNHNKMTEVKFLLTKFGRALDYCNENFNDMTWTWDRPNDDMIRFYFMNEEDAIMFRLFI